MYRARSLTLAAFIALLAASSVAEGAGAFGEKDAESTVAVNVGDTMNVALPANYRQPTSSSGAVSRIATSGGFPSSAPATATFKATRSGRADLVTVTDAACFHTEPACKMPQRSWVLHVVVK